MVLLWIDTLISCHPVPVLVPATRSRIFFFLSHLCRFSPQFHGNEIHVVRPPTRRFSSPQPSAFLSFPLVFFPIFSLLLPFRFRAHHSFLSTTVYIHRRCSVNTVNSRFCFINLIATVFIKELCALLCHVDDDITSRAACSRERSDVKCECGRAERFERKRVRF